jgi:hypothetical protein
VLIACHTITSSTIQHRRPIWTNIALLWLLLAAWHDRNAWQPERSTHIVSTCLHGKK